MKANKLFLLILCLFSLTLVVAINWNTDGIVFLQSPANNSELNDFNSSYIFSGNSSTSGAGLTNLTFYNNFNGVWVANQTILNLSVPSSTIQNTNLVFDGQTTASTQTINFSTNGTFGGNRFLSIENITIQNPTGTSSPFPDKVNITSLDNTFLGTATFVNSCSNCIATATFSPKINLQGNTTYKMVIFNETTSSIFVFFDNSGTSFPIVKSYLTFIGSDQASGRMDSLTNVTVGAPTNVEYNWTFNSSIPFGSHLWNVKGCATDGTCGFSINGNFTLNKSFVFNSETHNDPVTEISSQMFQLNVTLPSGLISSDGFLVYNGTTFSATKTTVGPDTIYTKNVTTPNVATATNISWQWYLDLNSGSGSQQYNLTNGTQQVNNLAIDDCSSYSTLVLNYTMYDEETKAFLNGTVANTTMNLELTLTSTANSSLSTTFAQNYTSINPAQVCVDTGVLNNSEYTLDSIISYTSTERVTEFQNIQSYTLNNNTIPQNIGLYDLLTIDSQEFLITYKDSSFLPVPGALIDIQRKYIQDGVFRSVEVPETDSNGQTIGHFVLSDVIYSIIVSKDGVTLATFNNIIAVCDNQATGDCRINLQEFGGGVNPGDFGNENGLSYNMSFNEPTRTITAIFSTNDGSQATVSLNSTLFNNFGNTTVCSDILTSSSGTLTCIIPESYGNATVIASLYKGSDLVAQRTFSIIRSAESIFGGGRVIMIFILIITLAALGLSISAPVTLSLYVVGIIIAGVLNLYEGGTLFGLGSTVLWLVIATGILIWKMSSGGRV